MRTSQTPFVALSMMLITLSIPAADKAARNDAHGDPLPDGALARLGTIRFRDGQANSATVLSPDGKTIAVAGNGIRPVRLLDATTGKEVRQMKNAMNGSSFLAFSPDGKVLASSYYGNQITLWKTETGDVLHTLGNGQTRTTTFSFSGDGKRLVTGNDGFGQTNPLTVWDVTTGKQIVQIEPIQNYNLRAVLTGDGKMMASWGQFIQRNPMPMANRNEEMEILRSIQLWDVGTSKELRRIKIDLNTYINNVLFAPDGKSLVTAAGGSAIIVWDTATGKELRRFAGRRNLGATMTFSLDGKLFAATTQTGAVQLWDYATGRRLGVHELPIGQGMRIAFTTDNKLLAWQSSGQAISIWDVRTEKPLTPVAGHESAVSAVAFSPNGQTVFSMSNDGTICQWEAATAKETTRRTLRDDDMMMRFGRIGRQQQGGAVSPDGKYVLTSDFNGAVLWEMATAREVCSFPGGFNPFGLAAVFSPDGNRLALGGLDPRGQAGSVRILDVNTGQEVKQLDVGAEQLRGLAFSIDGKSLVAFTQVQQGIGSQEVRLWNIDDGKKRWQVSRPGYTVQTLACAPDGLSVALCEAGAITMLIATTGEELRKLVPKEGMNNIQRLVFSPDGRTLAVAGLQPDGRSGRVHVWELSTGTLRQDLVGHQGMIASLAFAPDGSKLATGGMDTSILLWDLVGRDVEAKSRPAAKELDEMWTALDNVDGKEGFRVMGRLLAAPADAVALFKKNVEPVKGEKSDAEKIAQWVVDLDHKRFNKREEASKQLELIGRTAEEELKKALADNPSVEKKKRITELLGKLQMTGIKPELVRPLRAIEVLERLGTTEARQVLETLAGGAPEARLTREAKTALERMVKASKPTS